MAAKSTYNYRARDVNGQIVTGTMVAESAEEINHALRAEGKLLLGVDDRPMRASAELDADQVRLNAAARSVRREDVIALAQQLSVMLETGVPLTESLDAFCQRATRREFKLVLEALREDLNNGLPFSVAMAKWPRVFPTMMISLMKASEASGTMALMLGRIGEYLDRERRTLRQIKGALAYPLFMMFTAVAMTGFLMTFVLPRFAKIYEARQASLPTPTRVLLGVSDFLTTGYVFYLPALLVGGIAGFFVLRTRRGRRWLDWCRLNLPVIGTMYRQLYITRTARTMATLLSAGVNLLDIIDICRGVTNNSYYDDLWAQMEHGVREGQRFSDAVDGSSLIPPNISSMIASGERAGRLGNVMGRIAEFSDAELEVAVKKVTSFIEPVMIIFMGLLIGSIAMALLLPVFSMGKVMTTG